MYKDVYNTLIRAQTASGNIEKARDIFESLADPPSGVHAPGNHATDTPTSTVSPETPTVVYREPSTFEAMIRSEITAGEQSRATELLQRATARAFPKAIIDRLEKLVRGEEQSGPLFTMNNVPPS